LLAYLGRKCVIYFSQNGIDACIADRMDDHVDEDLEENRNG